MGLTKPLLKLALQAVMLAGVVAAVAIWPLLHYSTSEHVAVMLFSSLICTLSAVLSLLPLCVAIGQKADWLAQACLGGTVIRLLLTLFLSMLFYLVNKPSIMLFAVWICVFYMVLLAWETKTALGYIKKLYNK